MECWPPARSAYASERRLGMKSGKRSIIATMLNLHSLMMLTGHIFSIFANKNIKITAEYVL